MRRRIGLLIWKEFLQLRRDPLLLRVILLMPVAQLVLFGYVVAADLGNLSTAVVDRDRTAISRRVEASFASRSEARTPNTSQGPMRGSRGQAAPHCCAS